MCPLVYWCSPEHETQWKNIELSANNYPVQTIIGGKKITHNIDKVKIELGPITEFTLETWYSICKQLKLGKELGLLRFIGWDDEFEPARTDSMLKQWKERAMTTICKLIKKGEMISFQEMKDLSIKESGPF